MPLYLLHYQKVQISQEIHYCPKCNTHMMFKSSNKTLLLLLIHPNPFTSLFELSECYKVNVPYVLLFWKCPPYFVVLTEPGSSQGNVFLLKGWLYYYFCLLWIDSIEGSGIYLTTYSSFLLPTHFSFFLFQKSISLKESIRTFPDSPSLSSSLKLLVTLLFIEDLALFSSSP